MYVCVSISLWIVFLLHPLPPSFPSIALQYITSSLYIAVCRRGIASLAALKLFLSAEVSITSSSSSSSSSQQLQQQVFHIEGGLTAWSTDVDSSFEMY
jgi:rhodanese-related sulfurtransferase